MTREERYSYLKKWHIKNPNRKKEYDRISKIRLKTKVFSYYSKDEIKCQCCGEKELDFLCLDHINNDGYKMRTGDGRHRILGGHAYYRFLLKNEFPDKLQVLCHNCNHGKQREGGCPHTRPGYVGKLITT